MDIKESLHTFKRNIQKTIDYFLPDKIYLKKMYKKKLGIELDLDNPKTFNDKLNWLKLYDRNPEYTKMVDKYEVREYIKEIIENQNISLSELGLNFIPVLGVWDKVEEIDLDSLPERFVLKCTHDSESVILVKNKSNFDFESAKNNLRFRQKRNSYKPGREWVYKNVKPRIIAEQYMFDATQPSLNDYKFFCFNGKVEIMFVATDRPNDTKFDFFDLSFNHLPIINGHPNSDKEISKPKNFNKMIYIAESLSKGIPHVRVDLYEINGEVYFGEMTFYHHGGFVLFEPDEWNYTFGKWIQLPPKKQGKKI